MILTPATDISQQLVPFSGMREYNIYVEFRVGELAGYCKDAESCAILCSCALIQLPLQLQRLPTSPHTMDECTAGTSVSTIRSLHINMPHQSVPISSMPSTPGSSALPSSPADSVSSLPSVGSSYFFSSAAASPPHSQPSSDHHHAHGLVIPELTLPSALRRPTPYGQTLGDLRILVTGTGKRQLARQLVDDNDDVVEVGTWHDAEGGCSVLHASTDWIEHRDAHGLEKFEGTRNVEIVELPSYEHTDDVSRAIYCLININ